MLVSHGLLTLERRFLICSGYIKPICYLILHYRLTRQGEVPSAQHVDVRDPGYCTCST